MKVFLVAGEESGDRLGAALMRALKERDPGIVFSGVGSSEMAAEGLQSLFPIGDLAIVGFATIPQKLPKIFRHIRETVQAAIEMQPDVMVIIDAPDFTHRVARRVRKAAPHIPIIDYVSPSVWAWRPGRAKAMRNYVDHVLALLPFEPDVHRKLGGPPCSYVGHPVIEQIDFLRPNAVEAARRKADPPILLVLPGSRRGEIKRLLEPFRQTIELISRQVDKFEIVIPTTAHLANLLASQTADWPQVPRIVVAPEERYAAFRQARVALAKSGTVTLELAVSGVPMVTAYKVSEFEAMIARRVIQVSSAILANLVLGENVVPEFIQQDCRPELLAKALLPLLSDTPERRRQVEAFARLDAIMGIGQARPAQAAAGIVLDMNRKVL